MLHRILPRYQENNYYYQRQTAISWSRFLCLLDEIEESALPVRGLSTINDPNQAHVLSFDDAYADIAPALDEILHRGMTATVFPVQVFSQHGFSPIDDMAHYLDQYPHIPPDLRQSLLEGRLKKLMRRLSFQRYRYLRQHWFELHKDASCQKLFLTDAKLKFYIQQGIEVGIHGVSHRTFPSLSKQALSAELQSATTWLRGLGARGTLPICFPHGAYDLDTVALCLQWGKPLLGVDTKAKHPAVWRRTWVKETC